MTAPHLFVLAPGGMLGRAFVELLERRGLRYRSAQRADVDLSHPELLPGSLSSILPDDCSAVINCAAYTRVDDAETEETAANAVNCEAVGILAEVCRSRGIPLVHFSTDYVFAGNATAPYPIDAPHAPINAYGRSKACGERALQESGAEHLLLRTSWVYAPWGTNFVLTMAKLSATRPTLNVVHDQRGRPTSAEYLAEQSLSLLLLGHRGTYHVTDGGECTWFEFTQAIVSGLGHLCDVQPCNSDAFPRPAKRPAYSVLDLSKTEAALGPSRRWQENLGDVLHRIQCGGKTPRLAQERLPDSD